MSSEDHVHGADERSEVSDQEKNKCLFCDTVVGDNKRSQHDNQKKTYGRKDSVTVLGSCPKKWQSDCRLFGRKRRIGGSGRRQVP